METGAKKFNPSMGHAFSNDAFGEGSVKLELTADNIKTFSENAQVGGSVLFRFNKVTTNGNNHYFAEILPVNEKKFVKQAQNAAKSPKKSQASKLD